MFINELCSVANVSRSGYYRWVKSAEIREQNDLESLISIKFIFEKYKRKPGARQIKMYLERELQLNYNLKRINRIKKKFNLVTQKRKRNVYRDAALNMIEHRSVGNLLNQNFKIKEPRKVLSTDVTYMTNSKGGKAYLSAVKDLATKEIVSYELSKINNLNFVINSIKKSIKKSKRGVTIHSDQGFQYTHQDYQLLLKKNGARQSMSRRGNCLDNAPIESFFGHMKDEVEYKKMRNFEELKEEIDKYIKFYNEKRPQWGLKRKTPVEYRSFLS